MIGVDVVEVARVRRMLERSPSVERRLFTDGEIAYCRATSDPAVAFAGTIAAKEAVMKALRLGMLAAWARRIEIRRDAAGAPSAHLLNGSPAGPVEVSISHDAGVAVAVALHLGGRSG